MGLLLPAAGRGGGGDDGVVEVENQRCITAAQHSGEGRRRSRGACIIPHSSSPSSFPNALRQSSFAGEVAPAMGGGGGDGDWVVAAATEEEEEDSSPPPLPLPPLLDWVVQRRWDKGGGFGLFFFFFRSSSSASETPAASKMEGDGVHCEGSSQISKNVDAAVMAMVYGRCGSHARCVGLDITEEIDADGEEEEEGEAVEGDPIIIIIGVVVVVER